MFDSGHAPIVSAAALLFQESRRTWIFTDLRGCKSVPSCELRSEKGTGAGAGNVVCVPEPRRQRMVLHALRTAGVIEAAEDRRSVRL